EIFTKKVGIRPEENHEECRIGPGTGGLDASAFPVYPVCRRRRRASISKKKTIADSRSRPLRSLFCRRFAGSPDGQEDSPMGPISRHVLHSSWNLGFVAGWDRIFTLFLVQALNCSTIGQKLNSSVGMCINDPNRSSETMSAAPLPI